MRVHVLADMEGVAGVCRWAQVSHDGALYQEGRRLYTQEINAAVRGAFNAGALSFGAAIYVCGFAAFWFAAVAGVVLFSADGALAADAARVLATIRPHQ